MLSLLNTIWQIVLHFAYYRPDKLLATIILPILMVFTLNVQDNVREYKNFIMDK